MKNSNSSGVANAIERFRYLLALFLMRYRGLGTFDNAKNLARINEYSQYAANHNIILKQSQILEIGFGQRPYLGITLHGLGYSYIGIDLDLPIFPPSLRKFWRLYSTNGMLRLLKSLIRFYFFDRAEYKALFSSLHLPKSFARNNTFFFQADAATVDLHELLSRKTSEYVSDIPLVVISESVFEHIPTDSLKIILSNLKLFAESQNRTLLILTRPTIYTGICGSHLTEWYHSNVYSSKSKRSAPWEHLRSRRFTADTYLNEVTRAGYRSLFNAAGYKILSEREEYPGLGAEYLQEPELRAELSAYADEELLSNEVMFELVLQNHYPSP
jgi:hypothetical protein